MDRVDQLVEAYWQAANERGPHLEEFCEGAAEGRFGEPASPAEIEQFLRIVRAHIIENIENKAQVGGPWAMMKDQVIADTEAEIQALIERFGTGA